MSQTLIEQAFATAPLTDQHSSLESIEQILASSPSDELNHAIEKAKRGAQMEMAQKKIKQLEEIVTMCAWSGKIQMDGKWVKIEEFLNKRFGIKVSHGISEEEAEKVFKQINEENQNQTGKKE